MDWLSVASQLLTPVSVIIALITFLRNARKDAVKDATASTQALSVLNSDLGYIKSSTDDIKAEMKAQRQDIIDLKIALKSVEESTKQAHKRIDGLEGRLHE